MNENKSISLLAKWIPRQTRQPHIVKHLANILFPTGNFSNRMKLYRKKIVPLNTYIETIKAFLNLDNPFPLQQPKQPEFIPLKKD